MLQKRYKGVVVPMITPLTKKGSIDKEAIAGIMGLFAQNGISPLILGTTGESSSFSEEEGLQVLKAALAARSVGQQIYTGVVSNRVEEQRNFGKRYLDMGADVVVATLPAYYMLAPDQMKKHFETLADSMQGPLMIYNIKATTRMSIPLEVIDYLSHHPYIWGLKDSEREEKRLGKAIQSYKERPDFSFFCGWGSQCAASLELGADGIVPSTGNIVPEMYRALIQAVASGDLDAVAAYQVLTDRVAAIYQREKTLGQSLAALKLLMENKGLCHPYMKPPLNMLSGEMAEQVIGQWQDFQASQ